VFVKELFNSVFVSWIGSLCHKGSYAVTRQCMNPKTTEDVVANRTFTVYPFN